MPKVILPDDGTTAAEPDEDAPVVGHRIEISTNYVSIVLDYPGATVDTAYWTWKRALDALASLRAAERSDEVPKPVLQGNAMGFQFEQAGEELNTHLPGGWVA